MSTLRRPGAGAALKLYRTISPEQGRRLVWEWMETAAWFARLAPGDGYGSAAQGLYLAAREIAERLGLPWIHGTFEQFMARCSY